MIPAGVKTEQRGIEHERQPREGDPIAVAKGRETPGGIFERKAAPHVRILADVNRVVDHHEANRHACR